MSQMKDYANKQTNTFICEKEQAMDHIWPEDQLEGNHFFLKMQAWNSSCLNSSKIPTALKGSSKTDVPVGHRSVSKSPCDSPTQ